MKPNKIQDDTKEEIKPPEVQDESEVWKNKYMRALADYQNLEKRTIEDSREMRLYATRNFLEKLLPIIDNLERAEAHLGDEGLAIAMKELHAVLEKHGVAKIEVVGKPFDPYTMECIEVIEGEKNEVVEMTSPGYMMHGKLLREAKVKVGGGLIAKV
jgi:molecular chaperone GrpE